VGPALDRNLGRQEGLVLEMLEDVLWAWILRLVDLSIVYHQVVPIFLVVGEWVGHLLYRYWNSFHVTVQIGPLRVYYLQGSALRIYHSWIRWLLLKRQLNVDLFGHSVLVKLKLITVV
jgi:hypothetical protein